MTVVEILERARARIESPEHLATRDGAQTATGEPCSPLSRKAVRWCTYGAIYAVTRRTLLDPQACSLLLDAARRLYNSYPAIVNDTKDHAAVLSMFDAAIETARAQEAHA